jgi:homoserine dehydrogenase
MDGDIRPTQVDRTGIRDVTQDMLREAIAHNQRIKLLCRAWREGDRILTRVAPQAVSTNDPFASMVGTDSILQLHTDTLPNLTIIEGGGGTETTAFGVMADLLSVVRRF